MWIQSTTTTAPTAFALGILSAAHSTPRHPRTRRMSDTPPRHPAFTKAAFEHEFTTARPTLHIIAAAEAGRSDAEDTLHEAAIVALKRLDRFEPGTNFLAWMAAIIRGVAANSRRSNTRRLNRHFKLSHMSPSSTVPAPYSDPDFTSKLQHAIDSLDPQQRCCLLLRAVRAHSYKEIATITGITEATARSHVFRARKRLAETLPVTEGGTP